MRVLMICMFVSGWLALLSGHAAAQPGTDAAPATCGVDIDDQKADAVEAACLLEFAKRASRKGDRLTLRLENGASKVYRSDPKACAADDVQKCTYYRFVGYHAKAQAYSIAIQYYEGRGVELVSARTGNVLRLSGTPYFSADGSRFIVIDNDYAYGGPYDLAIGSTANSSFALEWQQESKEGPLEWRLQRWIDNDRIALRVFPAETGQKCPANDCDAILLRFQNSWALRRLPAKQQ